MESDLILRACRGDENAFRELVELHREAVYRLAYLMLRHEQDAQDVLQETFLRAYQNLHRFDTTRSLRPWLLSIAANLSRNQRRDLGRYWRAVARFARLELPETEGSAEKQIIQEADVEAVLQAVERLKTGEREIIYLRYFLDLSVEDTAAALKIRPGTVKSRLHRAIKQLGFEMER